MQRRREILEQCERDPNRFIKRTYLPMLTESRKAVAGLIGAEGNVDEVVLVPNASSGVQGVLREIEWEEGDVIMVCECLFSSSTSSLMSWSHAIYGARKGLTTVYGRVT